MQTTTQIIAPLQGYAQPTRDTKTAHSAPPQDIGAPSPDHPIRDRSAKQRALPVEKPARPFVSRCFEVKLPCVTKMVYIALAHRCKVWTDGTEDDVRISRKQIAADAGLSIRKLKLQIASLVDDELVTVKRTGRTNIYTVRIPAAALVRSNVLQGREPDDPEPWKADGVSRATWYRDRARTEPKTTHGGVRQRKQTTISSETDGPTGGPSDDPTGGPSTEGGSEGVRTKRNKRAVPAQLRTGPTRHEDRARCKQCGHTWKAKDGTACYQCGHDPGSTPAATPTTPDHYRGTRIRNCPSCQTIERGYEDRCQHCGWERA